MKDGSQKIIVDGIPVEMVRKRVKHLRLMVSPPHGRVRLSVPYTMGDTVARAFLRSKLDWVRDKRARFEVSVKTSPLRAIDGECHYFLGVPHTLTVQYDTGRHRVAVASPGITLTVRPGTAEAGRLKALDDWYRVELKARLPAMLLHWQAIIGVEAADWGVKKMRTRWGSCNIQHRRIWLNLELAKQAPACIEFVLVHELVHLLERYHNHRFKGLMDRFMPQWRDYQCELEGTLLYQPVAGR